jgi:corrinoid protein of di/trimethylamine methyltransferase
MGVDVQRYLKDIQNVISELAGVENVENIVIKALDSGVNPVDVMDAMSRGLEDVGEKYDRGEYFLSELIMAGIMANGIINILKPHLEKSAEKPAGKVVIGTVKGDLHDIGKNIVIAMLSSAGFRMVDLGIDVPSEKFVDAVKREKPDIVAMSCLLTIAMDEMRTVIDKLKEANLREDVKVMVGGRPITPQFAEEIGADAYGSNAVEAVKIAKALILRGGYA